MKTKQVLRRNLCNEITLTLPTLHVEVESFDCSSFERVRVKSKRKTARKEAEKMSRISVSTMYPCYRLTCLQSYQNRLQEEREFPLFIRFPSAYFNLSQSDWIGCFCLDKTQQMQWFQHRFSTDSVCNKSSVETRFLLTRVQFS